MFLNLRFVGHVYDGTTALKPAGAGLGANSWARLAESRPRSFAHFLRAAELFGGYRAYLEAAFGKTYTRYLMKL